jgi:glycerol-3-phosphate dehydrogenase
LRYLEHGEFRLVRESLAEREVLLRMAPHLVRPLRLVLPDGPSARPRWLVHAGLFLYDHLGGRRTLPAASAVDLTTDVAGQPLHGAARRGFAYFDCLTDDARLTVVIARDAALRGAEIMPRTTLVAACRDGGLWQAKLSDVTGGTLNVAAQTLVNAAGPWVLDVATRAGLAARPRLRLLKGSHIVVPKLYDGEHAYLLQNDDRRIVFVIPFERDYSLIGTTELPFSGDPAAAQIEPAEIGYLCRAVGRWFRDPPTPADVVWSFAGVRPLYDDRAGTAAAVTRDYVFDLDTAGPPALSIFGGKLTTHRRLAEHALAKLAPHLPDMGAPWTAGSILPGGKLPPGGQSAIAIRLVANHPTLSPAVAARLAAAYGSEAAEMLAGGVGREIAPGLFEAELRWLVECEWACTADDVLWRRTKLGLRMTPQEMRAVENYLTENRRDAVSGEHGREIATSLRSSQ